MKITIRTKLPRKKKKRFKKALSKISCAGLICWAVEMEQWRKLWINKMKGTGGPMTKTHKFSVPTGPQNGGVFIDSQPGEQVVPRPVYEHEITFDANAPHPNDGVMKKLIEAEPGYLLTTETDPKMLAILKRINQATVKRANE